MSLEDDIRRQMEQKAADEQLQSKCPVSEDVDAAFGMSFRDYKARLKREMPKEFNKKFSHKRAGGKKIDISRKRQK